jgi:hypothetical protein
MKRLILLLSHGVLLSDHLDQSYLRLQEQRKLRPTMCREREQHQELDGKQSLLRKTRRSRNARLRETMLGKLELERP